MIRSLPALLAAVRASPRGHVLACAAAADAAVIEGVHAAAQSGIVRPLLIGDRDKIARLAESLAIDVRDFEHIEERDPATACRRAVALCRDGKADALMKGAVPTSTVLKAVLSGEASLKSGRTLNHVTVFEPRDARRLLLLADAGVNIAPDAECKLDIIENCIALARALGIEKPRVALLAALETENEKMPVTVESGAIVRRAEERFGSRAFIGGPYSLDAAVSRAAAEQKGLHHEVAGRADILIAPDIEAGNVLYKALTVFAGLDLASLVLGATAPLVIPSRSDPAITKLYSIALAMLIADSRRLS